MAVQLLGVLNDNLLKGVISFLVVTWAPESAHATILAASSFLLVAPFLMFSAWGGRLASRFPKAKVVAWAKFAELPIMAVAAFALFGQHLTLALIALACMGIQSALHVPSKMGLIAETAAGGERSWATGVMETLSFVGVLLGMLVAGAVAEMPAAVSVLACTLMGLAVAGWFASRFLKYRWPAPTQLPTANPVTFGRNSWKRAAEFTGLRKVLLGEGAFWFIGGMLQLVLLMHLPEAYGASAGQTALVVAAMAVGIGAGCWVAGKRCARSLEMGLVPVAAWGMVVLLAIAAWAPLSMIGFTVVMVCTAFLSGIYKVPLNVWVQQRIPLARLGEVLALDRMVSFSFVLVSALVFAGLATVFSSGALITVMAVCALALAFAVSRETLGPLVRLIAWCLARTLFRFRMRGLEHMPTDSGALVVANHTSYLDFLLVTATVPRQVRFVMLKDVYDNKWLKPLLSRLNMIPISPRKGGNNLEAFNQRVRQEIADGHVVCIFAEGTVSRTGQMLVFRKGVEHLSEGLNAPVIPIHFDNTWGTPMSYSSAQRRLVSFSPKYWRRQLTATVGAPAPHPVKASALRQQMVEMEADAFALRPRPRHTLSEVLYRNLSAGKFYLADEVRTRTSRNLLREAADLAMRLEQVPGTTVAVAYENSLNLQYAIAGAVLARKTIVPLNVTWSAAEAQRTLQLAECSHVVTSCAQLKTWGELSGVEYVHAELEHGPGDAHCWSRRLRMKLSGWKPLPFPKDRPVFRVVDDSQEGAPLMNVSVDNVWALRTGLKQVAYTKGLKKLLVELPGHDTWGVMLPLLLASEFNLSTVLVTRENAVDLINLHRPGAAVMHSGNLPALAQNGPADLSFLQQIHVGMTPVDPEVLEALEARGTSVFASAGLNRTTSLLSVNMPDFNGKDMVGTPMHQKSSCKRSVGRPLPGLAVRIVDPTDPSKPLEAGTVGRVLVKGAGVVSSCFASWADHLASCVDQWVMTPFYGKLDEHGFLRLA